jgi:hypothetical protein
MTDLLSRRSTPRVVGLLAAFAVLSSGCAVTQAVVRAPVPASTRAASGAPALNVPPGHYPPTGMCRVWIPGRPPGRQARPVACTVALANAPAGSWVLHRVSGREIHSRVIDAKRPRVVVEVHVYSADDGRHLRSERP